MNTKTQTINPWVTVGSFSTPIEAHIAASALENEGIESFVRDEYSVGMRPYLSLALGGVRLDVPAEHLERAREILAAPEPQVEQRVCPRCGGEGVLQAKDSTRTLTAVLSFLLCALPTPLLRRQYRCERCAHEWRQR